MEHIASGRVKPLLARTYPLSDIRQAQRDFMNKTFCGKLVLILNRPRRVLDPTLASEEQG